MRKQQIFAGEADLNTNYMLYLLCNACFEILISIRFIHQGGYSLLGGFSMNSQHKKELVMHYVLDDKRMRVFEFLVMKGEANEKVILWSHSKVRPHLDRFIKYAEKVYLYQQCI